MLVYKFYKDIFQENLELIINFINSAQEDKRSVDKRYERSKKKPRLS